MPKEFLFKIFSLVFLATFFVQAEGQGTEQQKQIPENKGIITIDMPETKKNVNVSREKTIPSGKSETIINIEPTDQKTITKTPGVDNEQVFPPKRKLNFEGKYYIPREGTTEWFEEAVKNTNEGIRWESFSDDFSIDRPGDTWGDMSKMFNFQFATTISTLAFISFAHVDGLKTEGRIKSFILTTAIMTGLELVSASNPKQHFCAKNFTAGLAGTLCGSLILTIGFGF